MGQLTNIVANNGAATPVAYTFTPLGPDTSGVQWFEQATPAPANARAAARVSVSLKRPKLQASPRLQGIAKAEFGIWLPFMESLGTSDAGITPPPTVAYELQGRMVLFLSERSTPQDRKNLRMLMVNAVGLDAGIVDVVDNLRQMY